MNRKPRIKGPARRKARDKFFRKLMELEHAYDIAWMKIHQQLNKVKS